MNTTATDTVGATDTTDTTDTTGEAVAGSPQPRRDLPLAGTINLRDVGGYRTADGGRLRWRTLLRSGALRGLDGSGQAVLAQLGLRTVVDLREDAEVTHDPDRLGRLAVEHRRVPIYTVPATRAAVEAAAGEPVAAGAAAGLATVHAAGAGGDLRAIYDYTVDQRGERLTAAVLALAAPGALPAIVHCSAGKDRTGLVIALVLDLAGVPAEVIAEDFALTAHFLRDEAAAAVQRMSARASTDGAELPAALLASPPELIRHALDRIHARHGDARGYLLAHGATVHALDRLVDALVAPAARPAAGA
ncbi:tyrosine-protein phosphatase [Frankia gtarii]|uniref:tyrosine-protein phosphatase n=1 Tax=Frankia gtarii TaxID=2950102 RepID=UPI0021BEB78F|nr:tyrosine-protein phosphatase [Frankia gtarii]